MSNDNRRKNVSVLGTEDQIFGFEWNYDPSDMWLILPAIFVGMGLMVAIGTLHRTLGLVAFAGVMTGALAYIYVTPNSEDPHERLWDTITFWTATKDKSTVYEGEDKRPEALTHVLRVRPDLNATQREDKALIGATHVDASSLALATNEEWESVTDDFEDFLISLQHETMFEVSGDPVGPEIMTDGLDDRLTDPDVRDLPALKDIIRTHQEVFPAEFQRRGTSTRQYHVHVPVSVGDAQLDDHSAIEKLGDLPFVGGAIRAIGGELTMKDMDHIEDGQASILRTRLQTVESGMMDLENCTPRRLTGDQHGDHIESFWQHTTPQTNSHDDPENSRFADAERDRSPTTAHGDTQ